MNHLLILAGGKGTRMNSELPKVLTPIKGRPMIAQLIDNIREAVDGITIVVGYRGNEIIKALDSNFGYIWQHEQLGTGHAVGCAKEQLQEQPIDNLVVMPGDQPLISVNTISSLIAERQRSDAKVVLATVLLPDFSGFKASYANCGRILRDSDGRVTGIAEYKDATETERQIREVNVSVYCFDPDWLWQNIDKLTTDNQAREYYLTDLLSIAFKEGEKIGTYAIVDLSEGLGVNTKEQLEVIERILA
jgi:bifunctional UDP-N-acetylglucosamine pyrophosphorylase / glucosamine-1-phosphate N-acetyltransferase